jgi:N-methylhydantoinase A
MEFANIFMKSNLNNSRALRIGIDVGGTFTDAAIWDDKAGKLLFSKVPSTPPTFADGVMAAGVEALSQMNATFADVQHFVHSSTVAANVVAEKKGARVGLITTTGFRDVLEIQRTRRDRLYDLFYDKPQPLVPRDLRLEVPERLDARGNVLVPLDENAVRKAVETLRDAGCEAIAVVFLFSFVNPAHELRVAEIIKEEFPAAFISISAKVNPEFREYERASTTVIDAYVKPEVSTYYEDLERRLRTEHGFRGRLDIIHSGGGTMTCRDAAARPSQTVESGPACGVIAATHLARAANLPRVVALDMGGTTAKAAFIEDGQFKTQSTLMIERLPVRAPVVDLVEISGGGGTLAWIDDGGLLHVGPRSAGSRPGPICYARGGEQPTITDANAVVGYYPEELIGGKMRLDIGRAREIFRSQLGDRLDMTETEAALGILRIANFDMEAAIRRVTTQRGIDARTCTLIAFGGAGPVHAATLARQAGIPKVIIPPAPGNVNAFGALIADSRYDYQRQLSCALSELSYTKFKGALSELEAEARAGIDSEGLSSADTVTLEPSVDARYEGQGFELTVSLADLGDENAWRATIKNRYGALHQTQYRYHDPEGAIEILSLRMTVVRKTAAIALRAGGKGREHLSELRAPASGSRMMMFPDGNGLQSASIYNRQDLVAGHQFSGPAIVEEYGSTTVIPPRCEVEVDDLENLIITVEA